MTRLNESFAGVAEQKVVYVVVLVLRELLQCAGIQLRVPAS